MARAAGVDGVAVKLPARLPWIPIAAVSGLAVLVLALVYGPPRSSPNHETAALMIMYACGYAMGALRKRT